MTLAMWCADMPEPLLRQAWGQRRRADWPASYEATMANPLLALVVRIHAGLLARRIAAATPAPRYGTRPSVRLPTPRPTFDRKRAAAGEREDD